jgi:hypothetical protein
MGLAGLIRRDLFAAVLLLCIGVQPSLAARRRGAKLYPNKETSADMSGMNRIFIGWVDLKEDDWALHGYSSKAEWAGKVNLLNAQILGLCQGKYLPGRNIVGAKDRSDENAAGYNLNIEFSDVFVDYNKYHLYLSIHFIDPKTNTEIGAIPSRPYFGNDWGLVNYLKAALEEVSQKIKVEVTGASPKK